jgi:hypothetical protein
MPTLGMYRAERLIAMRFVSLLKGGTIGDLLTATSSYLYTCTCY